MLSEEAQIPGGSSMKVKLALLAVGCALVCAFGGASAQVERPGDETVVEPPTQQMPAIDQQINTPTLQQPDQYDIPNTEPNVNPGSPGTGPTSPGGGDAEDSAPPPPSDLDQVTSAIGSANLFWRVSIARKASEADGN